MHERFLHVLKYLGSDATPAKILHHINITGLTRLQVASHFQNYRKTVKAVLPEKYVHLEPKVDEVENILLSSVMDSTCCGNISISSLYLPQSGFCAVV